MCSLAEALMRSSLRRKCFIRISIAVEFKKVSSQIKVTLEREMGWLITRGFHKLKKSKSGFGF